MAKGHRIFKIAKELNLASEEVTMFLKEQGVVVKSLMSTIDDVHYESILEHFQSDKKSAEQKAAFKRQKAKARDAVEASRAKALIIPVAVGENAGIDVPVQFIAKPVVSEEVEEPKAAKKTRKAVKKPAFTPPALMDIPVAVAADITLVYDIAVHVVLPEPEKVEKAEAPRRKLSKFGLAVSERLREEQTQKRDEVVIDGMPDAQPKGKKRRKQRKKRVDEAEVNASIKETLAKMGESSKKRKYKKDRVDDTEEFEDNILKVTEFTSAAELAELMDVGANEVIARCIGLGVMASINQRLDMDVIEAVADELGFTVEVVEEYGTEILEDVEEEEDDENQRPRPPIVTIMGHVDHGKTSLLDYIRKSNVVAGEVGGITQSIGAYEVECNNQAITFLDTPGHEAFTAMRARGAQLTDIVILVVAADDSVMPQTLEAYSHAQSAQVPVIVAINKIDRSNANIERVKQQLSEKNILIEEWGGKIPCAEISAKTGDGINELLELLLLQAEILELKANPDKPARGVVVEAQLDKGRGIVATVLIQQGTLKIGDSFVAGQFNGRVRAMLDERGHNQKTAPPSTPVRLLGFNGMPQAGDTFTVAESERASREISQKRQQIRREQDYRRGRHLTLDEVARRIKMGGIKELPVVIKGDSDGAIEAIADSLMKIEHEEVKIKIVHRGVGAIVESDVLLASASNSVILGFQVRPNMKARELAKKEQVDIRMYGVIYDAIADIRSALEGMLTPDIKEEILGSAEIREVFRITKVGNIGGCSVIEGRIHRNDLVRIIRDDVEIYEGRLDSLKRFKEDVREVASGYECGLGVENYQDIKVGDIIEAFKRVEVAKTLA